MALKLKFTEDGYPYFVEEDEEVGAAPTVLTPPEQVRPTPPIKEGMTDPLFTDAEDLPSPESLLRLPSGGDDPVERVLREAEEASRKKPLVFEDQATRKNTLPQRLPELPSLSQANKVKDLPSLPGDYQSITRAATDLLSKPLMRAYQGATGQMTEQEAQDQIASIAMNALGPMGPISTPAGVIFGAANAQEAVDPNNLPGATTIESIGGPLKVTAHDMKLLGGVAAFTAGMAFAPRVFRRFASGSVPRLRTVRDAAPGTLAISTPVDLARTYDDVNAGALRILRRAGVSPAAADRIEQIFRIQTRATANAMTDSAVRIGRMETPSYSFNTPVSLGQLRQMETQQVRDYLHVLDTMDDLRIQSLRPAHMNNPNAGPPVVRGMTLQDADQIRRNLLAANPQLADIERAYNANLRAMRRFESTGEYATIPARDTTNTPIDRRRSAAFLNAHRRHEVPWNTPGGRAIGDPVERGSAIDSLATAMRERLRARMENEAVGMYVDEMNRTMPGTFVRVTPQQLRANPRWKENTVSFKRRGRTETYTTDPFLADVLKMDPYYITGMIQNAFYATKRLQEITTTGELAPWFAPTSAIRSYQIGKLTAEGNERSPTILGSLLAVPQQLAPQAARALSDVLDRGSHGWLGQVFDPASLRGLSQRLAQQYERSFFAELEAAGGGRGSIMQQQTQANSRLTRAIAETQGVGRTMLEGYRSLLNAIHNAPAHNFARRNRGTMSTPELARKARHMTGDPRIGGQFYGGGGRAIRFENRDSRVSHTVGQLAKIYGGATEIGRTAVPWFNATVQGMKRLGEAYLQDPVTFTGRLWLYQMLPAAGLYLWARSQGTDPRGRSYSDYMMNGRSEYDKVMNHWIAIPGRPVEDGIRFPRFHEATIAGHMMEVALDHAFRSNIFPMGEDFEKAARSVGGVLEPPWPPLVNLTLAHYGMVAPQGALSGEAYRRRNDPYEQNGGLPASVELYARALAPGLADVVGEGYAAATQTPEGTAKAIGNGISAGLRRAASKAPIVRDLVGAYAPATGNTAITEKLFRKQRTIRQLDGYYRQYTKGAGLIGAKPRSITGEQAAALELGERPPSESAGLLQPAPTNALYNAFIEKLHDRFIKDAVTDRRGNPTGAIGFQSLWNRYGIATRNIQRLRRVNEGNHVSWVRHMENSPEQMRYLRENKVDPFDLRAVRNHYERIRQDAARVLLHKIEQVENEFSQAAGRKITLEDLNPYHKIPEGEAAQAPEVTPISPEVYNQD